MRRRLVLFIVLLFVISLIATVFLWTRQVEEYYPPSNGFYVSISADGNYILARRHSPHGLVHLFSRENNVPVWSHDYFGWIDHATISTDGEYVAVYDRQSAVNLFQKTSNTPLWTSGTWGSEGLQISSDGERILIVAPLGYSLIRWSDNIIFSSYDFPYGSTINASIMADDNYIFVERKGEAYLFSTADNSPAWSYQAESAYIDIAPDLSYILVRDDEFLYLISREDNALLWSYEFSEERAGVAVSPDSNYIILKKTDVVYFRKKRPSGGSNGFYLFSKNENTPIWSYESDEWVGEMYLSISTDGSYIIAAHERGLYLFSRESGTALWYWDPPQYVYISSVDISADGSYIAVGAEGPYPDVEGSVYLFSKESNVPLWIYHETEPYSPI